MAAVSAHVDAALEQDDPVAAWVSLTRDVLTPDVPFEEHERAYSAFDARSEAPFPAWYPEPDADTNIRRLCGERGLDSYQGLYAWSVADRAGFWQACLDALGIVLREPHTRVLGGDAEHPDWLAGARLNIAESCFLADPASIAIVTETETWTVARLLARSAQVANALRDQLGLEPGDAAAIDMTMTAEAVAIYLGIVRAGCVAVSIADSFSPPEIATRLRIGQAKAVFAQDYVRRNERALPLYEKVVAAGASRVVVLPSKPEGEVEVELRDHDLSYDLFLEAAAETFENHAAAPGDATNVLFSSGTTGEPKAIPWSHTTPLKCVVDGWLHHDIQAGDVVCWPTNLGWMMGPWLIYASLVNRATIALYGDAPTGPGFARFVQDAAVTMLGVVPSLVKTWRRTGATEGCDWGAIKCFSSTGECSNPGDMLWLMSRAGYRPVIEYCGGTEIGGGYLTGTLAQPAVPALFTTPSVGLSFELHEGGEVFLHPPSIGLSLTLLNRDHHTVYFEGCPSAGDGTPLRRHGDQVEALPGGLFRHHGRMDDTMNLGGIKVGSAEIERVLNATDGVQQTAAIAVPDRDGGPARLVVYVEPSPGAAPEAGALRESFQARIRAELNPLFKVSEAIVLDGLPRTASNKVMRRELRRRYVEGS